MRVMPGPYAWTQSGRIRPRHHLLALQRVAWIHPAAQGQEAAWPHAVAALLATFLCASFVCVRVKQAVLR